MMERLFLRFVWNTADGGAGGGQGDGGGSPPDPAAGDAADAGAGGAPAGGGSEPWYGSLGLDDDTVRFIEGKGFPDLPTTLKSARESDRIARERNMLPMPEEGKINDWPGWEKVGWVKDDAQYTLTAPEGGAPEFYHQAMWDVVRKVGHENRVPLPALQAMHDAVVEGLSAEVEQLQHANDQCDAEMMAELKKDWGEDFDKKWAEAKRVSAALGLDDDIAARLEGAIGNDAAIMKMFAGIYEKIGEDGLVTGDGGGGLATESAASLQRQLRALEESEDFKKAFHADRHPRKEEFTERRRKLMQSLHDAQQREQQRAK